MSALCAEFKGVAPADAEFDHPAGASLARVLQASLQVAGWDIEDFDNWRDCGWVVDCRRPPTEVEVVVTEMSPGEWLLQVAPRHAPGLIGRLFGGKPSAAHDHVLELARVVHSTLIAQRHFSGVQWQWTPARNRNSWSVEPMPWSEAS